LRETLRRPDDDLRPRFRKNRYALLNFNKEHLALSETCIQIRTDIQTLMPSSSYYSASADALGEFFEDHICSVVGKILDEHAIDLLCIVLELYLPGFDDLSL
jgi:hypothetical protein